MGNAILVFDDVTVFGNKKVRTGTISCAASYATNGDTIVGGWDKVMGFKVERVLIAAVDVNYWADLANDKVKAYVAGTAASEFDEATSTDDLTGSVAPFMAIGKVS